MSDGVDTVADLIRREGAERRAQQNCPETGSDAPDVWAFPPQTGAVATAAAPSFEYGAALIGALRGQSARVVVAGDRVLLKAGPGVMNGCEALGLGLALIDAALQAGRGRI